MKLKYYIKRLFIFIPRTAIKALTGFDVNF
jgi:hypothetical protein